MVVQRVVVDGGAEDEEEENLLQRVHRAAGVDGVATDPDLGARILAHTR